jgi:hypothetical protein
MQIRGAACLLAVASVSLLGCADFRADWDDAKKVEDDIRGELHVDSHVNFRAVSGSKGNRLFVTVSVTGPLATGIDVASLKARVTKIVEKDFRSHVASVTVSF